MNDPYYHIMAKAMHNQVCGVSPAQSREAPQLTDSPYWLGRPAEIPNTEIKESVVRVVQRNNARVAVTHAATHLLNMTENANAYLTPTDKRELKQLLNSIIDTL